MITIVLHPAGAAGTFKWTDDAVKDDDVAVACRRAGAEKESVSPPACVVWMRIPAV